MQDSEKLKNQEFFNDEKKNKCVWQNKNKLRKPNIIVLNSTWTGTKLVFAKLKIPSNSARTLLRQ